MIGRYTVKNATKPILITGIAGSGKSSVCSELKRRGYKTYDIENIGGLFNMVNKITGKITHNLDNDDLELLKNHEWICDKNKLQKLVKKNKGGLAFYCGTASNIDELLPLFRETILLRASKDAIRRRLSSRKKFGNDSEVRKWVLSYKIWWEKNMKEKGAITVNANQSVEKLANDILKKI